MNLKNASIGSVMFAILLVATPGAAHAQAFPDFKSLGGVFGGTKKPDSAASKDGGSAPAEQADPKDKGVSKEQNPDDVMTGMFSSMMSMDKKESVDEELAVGKAVGAKLFGWLKPLNSPSLQGYVGRVGMTIASKGERKELPWRFVVVDSPGINAFAIPGGVVVVTKGLYGLLETEDELAAVLGHEIAHIQRQHHFKVVKQQKLVGSMGSMMSTGDSDSKFMDGLAARMTEMMARGLDQSAEFEADRDGMVLAARAGYDSSAILSVLEKLRASAAKGGDTSLLFATHPAPEQRLSALGEVLNSQLEAAAVPSRAAGRFQKYPMVAAK